MHDMSVNMLKDDPSSPSRFSQADTVTVDRGSESSDTGSEDNKCSEPALCVDANVTVSQRELPARTRKPRVEVDSRLGGKIPIPGNVQDSREDNEATDWPSLEQKLKAVVAARQALRAGAPAHVNYNKRCRSSMCTPSSPIVAGFDPRPMALRIDGGSPDGAGAYKPAMTPLPPEMQGPCLFFQPVVPRVREHMWNRQENSHGWAEALVRSAVREDRQDTAGEDALLPRAFPGTGHTARLASLPASHQCPALFITHARLRALGAS